MPVSQEQTTPSKPSLVHPDLRGLWSATTLGGDATPWLKFTGWIVMTFIFAFSWFGPFIPLIALLLFCIGYHTAGIVIFSLVMLPYVFTISPQPWLCRMYVQYGAQYFDGGCSMCFEGEPSIRDPKIPMCVGAHPHGLLTVSHFLLSPRARAVQDVKSKTLKQQIIGSICQNDDFLKRLPLTLVGQGQMVKAPVFNFLISQIIGAVPSSKKSLKALMRKKQSFWITPGGFEELSLFRKGENAIFITHRKGFIKYCLQFGYEIVPVYLFGEVETFHNLFYSDNAWINSIKTWLSEHKLPSVFPVGPNWFISFLPFSNTGLHGIFSKNTRYEHIENPTQEQIDEVHKWYVNELENLFERNKWRFGYDDHTKLKIL
eukprot:544867_1